MKREKVSWRGTPGVGDFMWALNSCYAYAIRDNVYVDLEMHWEHGEDYYHHFEDPETIIERMEYIPNRFNKILRAFTISGLHVLGELNAIVI